ncbi:uncharacterized protein LOC126902184 [Daktulosphaira vitifoliae]|uniref:uncharacterized protein LOC126902184 n=1 Tax=Daktulosphaira vitifoliae TaxID=58002 RepID=UPI0021AA0F2C|nr:uncharacterized protein LOC126902184 [Daktulosphaira vitifoliae]
MANLLKRYYRNLKKRLCFKKKKIVTSVDCEAQTITHNVVPQTQENNDNAAQSLILTCDIYTQTQIEAELVVFGTQTDKSTLKVEHTESTTQTSEISYDEQCTQTKIKAKFIETQTDESSFNSPLNVEYLEIASQCSITPLTVESHFESSPVLTAIYESNLVSEDLPDPGKVLDSLSMNMDYIIEPPTAFSDTATQSASLSPICETNLESEDLPDPGKVLDRLFKNMGYNVEPPTVFSDTSTQCSLLTPITDSILQYIESLYYVFGFTETSSLNEVHEEPSTQRSKMPVTTESFMKFAGLPDEVADLVIELMKMRQNVLQPNLESPLVMTATRVERYTQTNSGSELNDLTKSVLYTETGTQCMLLSPSTDSILQNIDLLYSAFGFK